MDLTDYGCQPGAPRVACVAAHLPTPASRAPPRRPAAPVAVGHGHPAGRAAGRSWVVAPAAVPAAARPGLPRVPARHRLRVARPVTGPRRPPRLPALVPGVARLTGPARPPGRGGGRSGAASAAPGRPTRTMTRALVDGAGRVPRQRRGHVERPVVVERLAERRGPGSRPARPRRANHGQNHRFMIAPYTKPHTQPYAGEHARPRATAGSRRVARPSSPAPAPIHARASIWNGSHGPMPPVMTAPTANDGQAEQEAEPRPEGGAAEDDQEEHAVAAAGQVEQLAACPAEAASTPSSATSRRSSSPGAPRAPTAARASSPTSAATSGASPAWAASAEIVPFGSQKG